MRNNQPNDTQYKKAVSNVKSMLQAAGVGQKSNDPLSERSRRLAKELEEFVERGMQGVLATERGDEGAPSVDAATELQIQISRMFRQVRGPYVIYIYVYVYIHPSAGMITLHYSCSTVCIRIRYPISY